MTSPRKGRDLPDALVDRLRRVSFGQQIIALAASLSVCTGAMAQGLTGGGAGASATSTTGGSLSGTISTGSPLISQRVEGRAAPSSTILPTDVVPLPSAQERTSFGENLQLRVLQRLPAPFYFNTSVEASVREETNIFQFPTKRKFLTQLPTPLQFAQLNAFQQGQINETLNRANAFDTVFRVLPNITVGWALKPRTRLYGNYFMIRDQLTHWTQLNTVIHSLGYGVQQDIPVGRRGNLQLDMQFRELYQLHSKPVFDFLPGMTFSYVVTPRMVLFVNALCQLRGKGYFRSPNKEIDPFYTWGGYYAKGGWAFSASTTFVQNFREPFHSQATIPVNNYSIISDYEIARRLIRQLPGFQVFARAEPIWNFHSHARPGLTGMDFRMFFGGRMQLGKPALTAAYEQIKQQLEEQESAPPPPGKTPGEAKPSAFLMPYQVTAHNVQPIHGLMDRDGLLPVSVAYPIRPLLISNKAVEEEKKAAEAAPAVAAVPSGDSSTVAKETKEVKEAAPVVASAPQTSSPAEVEIPIKAGAEEKKAAETEPVTLKPAAETLSDELPSTSKLPVLSIKETIESGHSSEIAIQKPSAASAPSVVTAAPEPAAVATPVASSAPVSTPQEEPMKLVILPPAQSASQIDSASSESGSAETEVSTRSARRKDKKKSSSKEARSADKKLLAAAPKRSEVQMVLVPPLPSVDTESRDNPFGDSGSALKPPIMLNPIR